LPLPRTDALSGSALDPKMTFESFVAGASNDLALGVARQAANAAINNSVTYNPFYIHSTVGLGKTHLLNAIAWAAGAADPGRNIVYLTADHFMYHFISAVQRQSAIAFKEWLRRVDLLLIDDMQFLQGKSATEFGHTLGTLLTGAKQVVVAADSPPRDLEMLDERVRSRLSGGLVVGIDTLDLDLRRAIVTRRVEQAGQRFAGTHFPPAVIDYVARVVVSHGRDLDGAVNRLLAANQLTKEPITVALAERTLADLVRSRESRRVRIEDILRIVSRHFKVPRNDLLSSRRSRDVVRPRQIAMYLAKSLTSRSLPEIGRRFGGRDHTTVLHSVRKVEQMMKDDGDLAQEIELLKRMLEE
jgi:chromosomal replication initiator protein